MAETQCQKAAPHPQHNWLRDDRPEFVLCHGVPDNRARPAAEATPSDHVHHSVPINTEDGPRRGCACGVELPTATDLDVAWSNVTATIGIVETAIWALPRGKQEEWRTTIAWLRRDVTALVEAARADEQERIAADLNAAAARVSERDRFAQTADAVLHDAARIARGKP